MGMKRQDYIDLEGMFVRRFGDEFHLMKFKDLKKAMELDDEKAKWLRIKGFAKEETINERYLRCTYGNTDSYPGCMYTHTTGQWKLTDFHDRMKRMFIHFGRGERK